jgi:hypothetical protein
VSWKRFKETKSGRKSICLCECRDENENERSELT